MQVLAYALVLCFPYTPFVSIAQWYRRVEDEMMVSRKRIFVYLDINIPSMSSSYRFLPSSHRSSAFKSPYRRFNLSQSYKISIQTISVTPTDQSQATHLPPPTSTSQHPLPYPHHHPTNRDGFSTTTPTVIRRPFRRTNWRNSSHAHHDRRRRHRNDPVRSISRKRITTDCDRAHQRRRTNDQ